MKKKKAQIKKEEDKAIGFIIQRNMHKSKFRRFLRLWKNPDVRRFNHLASNSAVKEFLELSGSDEVKEFFDQIDAIREKTPEEIKKDAK